MKVKTLIQELQKQHPERQVLIQQGLDFDYATIRSVKADEVLNAEKTDKDGEYIIEKAVVINYQ